MKQVIVRRGEVVVEEVPEPQVRAGAVLVQVHCSCVSVGTEVSGIRSAGMPLWKRALREPENVRRVLTSVVSEGVSETRRRIQNALEAGSPIGYSAAGTVVEVGDGVSDLRVGDRVACAGAQWAFHAEVICVPRNLVVEVPEGLGMPAASTVTLGAIALQGVRRAQPTLGEAFVVVGLGGLGQLTAQLLAGNGCRVIGNDLDRHRVAQAEELGLALAVEPGSVDAVDQVSRLTDGRGADGVLITAASASSDIISTAFRMCRKKGRVVLVGDVGLDLEREDFYKKELDLLISTSYGPGRYDPRYEEEGQDYPLAYVRWTENRNMAEYLRLVAEGRVRVEPLIASTFTVDRAPEAYKALAGEERPLTAVLTYPDQSAEGRSTKVGNPRSKPPKPGVVRLALVGAGGFATAVHLPNLARLSERCHLQAVVSRTGHGANEATRQFGATYASTDFYAVLEDAAVDAVLIATRHHLHASMAIAALEAGKHVLVEKPLALTRGELADIVATTEGLPEEEGCPVLLTGFNRRFSPYAYRILELVRGRREPMVLDYRMNAGYLPLDHWVHGEEGGGRNLGEACHIYDLLTCLTGSRIARVEAVSAEPAGDYYSRRDNFVVTLGFADGSLASLTYTSMGSSSHAKERMEVYTEGRVLSLDDYRRLSVAGRSKVLLETKAPEKGLMAELEAFVDAIQSGGDWPVELWQQVQATEIALEVEERLRGDTG